MIRTLSILLLMFLAISVYSQDNIVQTGQNVPEFSFSSIDGKAQRISDLKGKVVLINFFATWCGPCRRELPVLQTKIWNKYKGNKKFALLVIGREHTVQEIKDFKQKTAYQLPFYADPNREIYSKFAIQTIPRNYIIDKSGKVIYASIGYEEAEFDNMLTVLAKELAI